MKNLIRLQAIVMSIEEELKTEFKSTFEYKDFNEMTITTYCWNHTILIKQLTEYLNGVIGYIESNSKIKILDIKDKESEE